MNKLYCSNVSCAKPNYYEASKPKFCSHCGQSFVAGFAAVAHIQPTAPVQTAAPIRYVAPQPVTREPELDFSNFKIGFIEPPKKKTLGEIQSNAGLVPNADRPDGNQTDANAVLKENIRRAKHVNRDVEGE